VLVWIVGLHALALLGFFTAPSFALVVAALLLNLPGAIGLTLAFHRSIAHRSVTFSSRFEQWLIFWAMFNGAGSPASWAAAHRLHHRYEDSERDVSSPSVGGFWWAHLRWLWQLPPVAIDTPRLQAPRYRAWQRRQAFILVFALLWPLPLGFTAWVWLGPLRLVYIFHAQALINSAAHMGARDPRGGTSKDLAWLALPQFFLGESWHGSHHRNPSSARMGERWWHVDLGWQLVRLCSSLGLATQVRVGRPRLRPRAPLPSGTETPGSSYVRSS
jgi:fatty-acid desaturase